jgi:hypothetical protein
MSLLNILMLLLNILMLLLNILMLLLNILRHQCLLALCVLTLSPYDFKHQYLLTIPSTLS